MAAAALGKRFSAIVRLQNHLVLSSPSGSHHLNLLYQLSLFTLIFSLSLALSLSLSLSN